MDKLQQGIEYIAKAKEKVNPVYRPTFHYTSEVGWINDPNGFSIFNGEYHLFAQHYPYDSKWGPMHWAHATTKDFIKWHHKPIAIAPEKEYELDLGCFSGTAMEHDGKHILMYTGCAGKKEGPVSQKQCIAIGDGTTYEKLEANPVITGSDLPDFLTTADFRDPKIFKRGETFYCLIGTQVVDEKVGTMVLYKSTDLINWEYVGETLRAHKEGSMESVFECPDLFRVGDKDIIIASLSSAVYFIGDMNYETGKFMVEHYHEIDDRFDYYAPQTLTKPDGEVIMIAWAQMWERRFLTDELNHGWAGAMTLARKLELVGNRLYQRPLEFIENYQTQSTKSVEELSQKSYRLQLDVDLTTGSQFKLELLKTEDGAFKVIYNKEDKILIIDRSETKYKLDKHAREEGVNNRRTLQLEDDKRLMLDIIVDNTLVEIFVNDGQYTSTSNYYYTQDVAITSALNTDYAVSVQKYEITV